MCIVVEYLNVFMWYDMYCFVFDVFEFDEVGFECQDLWIVECKVNGCIFLINVLFWFCLLFVMVDEEGEFRVVE